MTLHAACKSLLAWIFGSPERDRLKGAIAQTKTYLKCDGPYDAADKSAWKAAADDFIVQAERYLNEWDIQQGWVALAAAERAMLLNPNKRRRVLRAGLALRREADKVTGWRAKAIGDLLDGLEKPHGEDGEGADKKGTAKAAKPVEAKKNAEDLDDRIVDAIALRDDQANTTYFKILLRRRSLFQLFLVLLLGIATCLVLSILQILPEPFDQPREVAAVVLFGMLGAGLSVGQGLLAADVSAKIPSQQIGSFVVWMRPAIGAAAALVAFALLHANEKLKLLNSATFDPHDFAVIAVIAVVAGFSERFIVGAIEKISKLSDKDDAKEKDSKDKGKPKDKGKDD